MAVQTLFPLRQAFQRLVRVSKRAVAPTVVWDDMTETSATCNQMALNNLFGKANSTGSTRQVRT